MPTTSEEQSQIADALLRVAAAIEQMQTRHDAAQRADRRVRVGFFIATLVILCGMAYLTLSPVDQLLTRVFPPKLASTDPEAAAVRRTEMLAALPDEERLKLQRFEQRLGWVTRYLDVSPEFNAGAAVAHVLADMSRSMDVIPDMATQMVAMNQEMRGMSAKLDALPGMARDVQGMNEKMNALPVLATEVQGMHVQMSVMASGVDSTMGRAGRMMPWNW
jgi:energy-converting hydrogenase Eha subunit F